MREKQQDRERERVQSENFRSDTDRYRRDHPAGYLLTERASGGARPSRFEHDRGMWGIPYEEQTLSPRGAHAVHRRGRIRADGMEHVGHPLERDEPGYGEYGRLRPGGEGHEYPLSAGTRRALRGPKNYVRPDERIYDELWQRLIGLENLDLEDLEIRVAQGVVTLEGRVPDRFSKYVIEENCEGVFGVREVVNQLRVGSA